MKKKLTEWMEGFGQTVVSIWKKIPIRLPKKKVSEEKKKEKRPCPFLLWAKAFSKRFADPKYRALLSRLSIALIALAFGGILILWDIGVIDLPFLVRSDRRDPAQTLPQAQTQTEEEKVTTTEKVVSPAQEVIDSIYAFDSLTNGKSLVTPLSFDKNAMTLTKQKLQDGIYESAAGFVIKDNGKDEPLIFLAPDLIQLENTEQYQLTTYRDSHGQAVFQSKETEEYFCYDAASKTFVPSDFNSAKALTQPDFSLPADYGKGEEGRTLISENGLFGYEGTYKDGWRTKTFSVPAVYPTAFNYSEGFAVMADETGKITIRNDKGEAVFTGLSLILPEKTGKDLLGFHYFSGGLLRVVIATYDLEGNLTSRRESIINTKGEEITLPAGFTPVSLSEGILLVKNGDSYGFLGANNAWIADPVYRNAEPFLEGLAVVTNKDGKMGMIDRTGKAVLPCVFDQVTTISDGICLLYEASIGWHMLVKVNGVYTTEKPGEVAEPSYYTKMSITRGPQNTFDYEPDEIIELPPVLSTPSRTTHPENTVSKEEK